MSVLDDIEAVALRNQAKETYLSMVRADMSWHAHKRICTVFPNGVCPECSRRLLARGRYASLWHIHARKAGYNPRFKKFPHASYSEVFDEDGKDCPEN